MDNTQKPDLQGVARSPPQSVKQPSMTPTSHNDEEQKKMVESQFDTDVQMADSNFQMSDMVAGSGNSSTVDTN